MTAADSSPVGVSIRGNLGIGIASIVAGAVVIPYGASMPYVREGIPGPGLFPMMIGGMLIILGALVILTALMSARRDRIHGRQLAAAEAQAPPGESLAPLAEADGATAEATSATTDTVEPTTMDADEPTAATVAAEPSATMEAAGSSGVAGPDELSAASPAEGPAPVELAADPLGTDDGTGAAVPASAGDVAEEDVVTQAVMDTDIGSDGARRWVNGGILMGSIVFYVLFAQILGFPVTMAIVVTAIVGSLRARWWVAVLTGVLTAIGLWAMFEQGLMVQLPDGFIRGF